MTKMPGTQPPAEDALPLAVMDFVRAVRNDDRLEGAPAGRRKPIIRAHAEAVAEAYGLEAQALIDRTGAMLAAQDGEEKPPRVQSGP